MIQLQSSRNLRFNILKENVIIWQETEGRSDFDREMSIASHRRIQASSKSTKRLTLQSLREFVVAWSTAQNTLSPFAPVSLAPFRLSLFTLSLLTTLENATSSYAHHPAGNGYEYRQLFFTLVEHISTTAGVERVDWCLGTIPNTPRGGSIARSLRLGFHHFRGENAKLPKNEEDDVKIWMMVKFHFLWWCIL